jgi:putative solute:sodium symporter small subunit
MADNVNEIRQQHWVKTRNLTWLVLVIWFVFAFVVPWNAAALDKMSFIGFPLGYYFCVQGSLIIFVALIFFQNWKQDKIDDEAGLSGE